MVSVAVACYVSHLIMNGSTKILCLRSSCGQITLTVFVSHTGLESLYSLLKKQCQSETNSKIEAPNPVKPEEPCSFVSLYLCCLNSVSQNFEYIILVI